MMVSVTKKDITPAVLIKLFPDLKSGMNLNQVIEVLSHFKISSTGYQCARADLMTTKLPILCYWQNSRFVILTEIDKQGNSFCIYDPTHKIKKITSDEFDQNFSDIVLVPDLDSVINEKKTEVAV